jgi:tetratricopeptide (TPR) repeat protein
MSDAEREYELGSVHDSAGRGQEAIPHYERALELGLPAPLAPRALLQLGSSLRNVGRNDEALALFDDALLRFPDDAALRLFRAFALVTAGRDREALVDVLNLARTRIDAPEIRRYARSLEGYTLELAGPAGHPGA